MEAKTQNQDNPKPYVYPPRIGRGRPFRQGDLLRDGSVSVGLPAEVAELLRDHSERLGVSKSCLARALIAKGLADLPALLGEDDGMSMSPPENVAL